MAHILHPFYLAQQHSDSVVVRPVGRVLENLPPFPVRAETCGRVAPRGTDLFLFRRRVNPLHSLPPQSQDGTMPIPAQTLRRCAFWTDTAFATTNDRAPQHDLRRRRC